MRAKAAAHGRKIRFGIRLHVIVRETNDEAWQAAERLISHLDDETIAKAQAAFARTDSVGQQRMAALHNGKRDNLEISPNLWAGVGLVRVAPWFLPVGIVAVWQLASSVGWLSTRILPSPEGVVTAFWTLSASGELWQHLAISSWRALIGFSIGGSLGLILGLISGLSRWGERLLDTSIQMLRNVPHLALIPLVILWFGIDESAKIFLVALGTLFPIYINTWHGIRNIDRGLVEMARSYGLSGIPLFIHVILPGALPSIMVGVRFALGLMWLTLIVAETISANSGIGYLAMNAREFLQTDVVVVAIILYALLGKLADVSAQLLERLWLRWNPAYHLKEATV